MILISCFHSDINIMPATDKKFVLRIPVEIWRELEAVKKASGDSINQQILRRLGYGGETKFGGKEAGDRGARGSVPSGVKRVAAGGKGGIGSEGGVGAKVGVSSKAAGSSEEPARVLSEVAECRRCGGAVRRDTANPRYWKCPKGRCGRQLDDSEVKR